MHMDELKAQKIWFCWNYEIRSGKRTKVPISAYGTPTGTNTPYAHTWVTHSEAAKEHGYGGVGFKIPEGYFFLDIDHRELSDPYVCLLLERFDSYTEYSVSGEGIHIYGKYDINRIPTYTDEKGKLRLDKAFYMKNSHNQTELYCGGITNRFAVYTGNVVRNVPLRECTDALLVTLDKNMRKKEKRKFSEKCDGGDKEVFDVVASLLKQKNGEKFRRLYCDGDWNGYGSQSEADCALCAMIAFCAGPDPDLIDRVFRSSALMREKWNRDDYRESTIEKGIEACHGTSGTYYHKYCRNANSIGVELCSEKDSKGKYYFTDETVKLAAGLVRELMVKYKVPVENVVRHYDVTHKNCPTPFVENIKAWENFRDMLRGNNSEEETKVVTKTKFNGFGKEIEVERILNNGKNYVSVRDLEKTGILKATYDEKSKTPGLKLLLKDIEIEIDGQVVTVKGLNSEGINIVGLRDLCKVLGNLMVGYSSRGYTCKKT